MEKQLNDLRTLLMLGPSDWEERWPKERLMQAGEVLQQLWSVHGLFWNLYIGIKRQSSLIADRRQVSSLVTSDGQHIGSKKAATARAVMRDKLASDVPGGIR